MADTRAKLGSAHLEPDGTLSSRHSNSSRATHYPANECREAVGVKVSADDDEQKEKHNGCNCRWPSHQNRQADQGAKPPQSEHNEPLRHWLVPPSLACVRSMISEPRETRKEGRNVVR